jgi:hypothetical protein
LNCFFPTQYILLVTKRYETGCTHKAFIAKVQEVLCFFEQKQPSPKQKPVFVNLYPLTFEDWFGLADIL